MNKASARKIAHKTLHDISDDHYVRWSSSAARNLVRSVEWAQVSSIHLYEPKLALKEPQTVEILHYLRKNWPYTRISHGEPHKSAPMPSDAYDVIVVPMVGFDDGLNRLGRGGGWYDRFLGTQERALKIGFAFEIQRFTNLPIEPHDIRMDMIVTEVRTITR